VEWGRRAHTRIAGRQWLVSGGRGLEVALEAEDVDGGAPHSVGAGEAIGGPLVGFVEVLGAEVVDKCEEVGMTQSKRNEMGAGCGDERHADAAAPGIGIDIESGELAVIEQVGLVRGSGGGEAEDVVGEIGVGGDDGVGVGRIGVGEVVFFGAVLGAELIEIAGGEKSGVAVLPGADVDARDGESVGGLSGTKEHEASIACERQ
jgi:hypothetical protein